MAPFALRETLRSWIKKERHSGWLEGPLSPFAAADIRQISLFATARTSAKGLLARWLRETYRRPFLSHKSSSEMVRQSQDETKDRFVTGLPKHLLTIWIQER